jgi:hypothetical protein
VWLGQPDEGMPIAESDDEILRRHLPQLAQLERWAQAGGAVAGRAPAVSEA